MAIVEVIVGMVFTFLLLSLLGTTVNELIAAWRGWRGFYLEEGLKRLLDHDESPKVFNEFRKNPFYKQLLTHDAPLRVSRAPAYLSGSNFTSILFTVLKEKGKAVEKADDVIKDLPEDSDLRKVLEQFKDEGYEKLDDYKLRLQGWFDDVMDQASGWYKRHLQMITLLVGLSIAAVLNADSFKIYSHLTKNATARKEMNALAEKYLANNPDGAASSSNDTPAAALPAFSPKKETVVVPKPATTPAVQPPVPVKKDSAATQPTAVAAVPDSSLVAKDSTGLQKFLGSEDYQKTRNILGLGWEIKDLKVGLGDWLTRLLGWLITALAISLGAPFWFDVLKKIITIRSSGSLPASGGNTGGGSAQVVINTGKTTTVK